MIEPGDGEAMTSGGRNVVCDIGWGKKGAEKILYCWNCDNSTTETTLTSSVIKNSYYTEIFFVILQDVTSGFEFTLLHLALTLAEFYERQFDVFCHIRDLREDATDVIDQRSSPGTKLDELNRRCREKEEKKVGLK